MKKLLILIGLLLVGCLASAQQRVVYYRYNFSFNVAGDAETDLEKLISQGFKIIGFSLDYTQKCMLVVYEDEQEKEK